VEPLKLESDLLLENQIHDELQQDTSLRVRDGLAGSSLIEFNLA